MTADFPLPARRVRPRRPAAEPRPEPRDFTWHQDKRWREWHAETDAIVKEGRTR